MSNLKGPGQVKEKGTKDTDKGPIKDHINMLLPRGGDCGEVS